jgi:hypothetical protein
VARARYCKRQGAPLPKNAAPGAFFTILKRAPFRNTPEQGSYLGQIPAWFLLGAGSCLGHVPVWGIQSNGVQARTQLTAKDPYYQGNHLHSLNR